MATRLSDQPLIRYPEDRPLAEDLGHWYVALVKPRMEKALARDLEKIDVSYYLPMVEKRTRRRDNNKIRKSWVVLFPNYLSFAVPEELDLDRVYATRRVATVLPVVTQEEFVRELEQIERALNFGREVKLLPDYVPGEPVRVKDGPLQGMEGTVLRVKNQTNLVVRVEMFQQAVAVEVDEVYLERL